MTKVKVTQDGKNIPTVGDVIRCTFADTELRYLVASIEGSEFGRFALVPMEGLLAGRIFRGNQYSTLVELYEALENNIAMLTIKGSIWEIVE